MHVRVLVYFSFSFGVNVCVSFILGSCVIACGGLCVCLFLCLLVFVGVFLCVSVHLCVYVCFLPVFAHVCV